MCVDVDVDVCVCLSLSVCICENWVVSPQNVMNVFLGGVTVSGQTAA
jgi:hypothetical protein